jgi:hypothetical protein
VPHPRQQGIAKTAVARPPEPDDTNPMQISSRIPLSLALLLLAANAMAAAEDPAPRANAAGIADAIEAHYFDAERGRRIANALRADAASGKFDALTDERDLATALSDRLKPLDGHFRVRWSPPAASTDGMATPAVRALPPPGQGRRGNHGVRRVEVLPGNIGYLDLRMFADFEFGKPDQPARKAIEAALQLLADSDAVVIDLRGNGGGSPAMVGYLASAFTPKGADIYNTFHYREGSASEAPRDWYPDPRLDVPLYLLASARTGSAAEAFAYTLKNAKRATVVGEATAGAANPGGPVDAGHGFTVFVSDGSPTSPVTGRNWEGEGVQPDVAAAPADALRVATKLALETLLQRAAPGYDPVDARWALEALRAGSAPPASGASGDYVGDYGSILVGAEGDRLYQRRGRRPALFLLPLGDDLFSVDDDPGQRVRFGRDAQGRVAWLETLRSDGSSERHMRGK